MTELERIQSEYQAAERYDGPDKIGAFVWSLDWRIEEMLYLREEYLKLS